MYLLSKVVISLAEFPLWTLQLRGVNECKPLGTQKHLSLGAVQSEHHVFSH